MTSTTRSGNGLEKMTNNVIKSNKCNQCDYASSQSGHLMTHLKTHSEEESNKCNQSDYASSQAGHLRSRLKIYSEKKSKQMQTI